MRKLSKFLVSGLLACALALTVAAFGNSNVPSPPPSEEGGRVTINDAYDWNSDGTGSTRPNLGEGYEEVLPPTSVKLTISANSDIRFKGGHTEYTLK